MTEATAQTKAGTATTAGAAETPAAMRDIAERGINQARETYETYRSMAEEATEGLEETFQSVNKGLGELQAKALANTRANVDAGFDFAEKMLGARSFAEMVELQGAFARRQFDTLSAQASDFRALAGRVQSDSTRPFRTGVAKAMSHLRQDL